MITFTAYKDVGLRVDQCCVPPTVYLDHWAWRRISESELLTEQFSSSLKSRGGTLALTWLNLIEFSKVTDNNQAFKADALLDKILPHVSFLNPNFFSVINEEDKLQHGGEPTAPHADLVTLKYFAKHNSMKANTLELLPKQNLFRLVQATGTANRFEKFADLIICQIERLRSECAKNKEFFRAVKRVPKGQPIQRGTRFIARELIGSLLRDKNVQIDRHHAVDVCHAIVSVAYCDFALLDGHWTTQVERARKRIMAGGLSFPIARVFSERANGITKFLQELRSGGAGVNK